jgi:uncharacterized protein (TIGR02284 family)
MNNKSVKNNLENVLDICHDGAQGYEHAADRINNTEISTIFRRLSQQRKLFAEELKNDARDLGFEFGEKGTVKGFFHRNWLDLKSMVSKDDISTIVDTAKTGEHKAVDTYDEAINDEKMPEYIKDKLKDQRGMIQGAIKQLESFKVEQ